MIRRNKGKILATSLAILLPILVGLLLWDRLPDRMPTHFNFDGEADGWSGKAFAVFAIPLILLACHLLCVLVTAADPRRRNISGKLYYLVLWICPAASFFCAGLTYPAALGMPVPVGMAGHLFVGALWLAVGNYLPKCRQNYTVGIKLPWTLHDEENWNKTHRLGGWVWTGAGILMVVNAFWNQLWLLLAVMLASVLIPVAYSFWLYQKKQRA